MRPFGLAPDRISYWPLLLLILMINQMLKLRGTDGPKALAWLADIYVGLVIFLALIGIKFVPPQ
jgi:hypothetical protein